MQKRDGEEDKREDNKTETEDNFIQYYMTMNGNLAEESLSTEQEHQLQQTADARENGNAMQQPRDKGMISCLREKISTLLPFSTKNKEIKLTEQSNLFTQLSNIDTMEFPYKKGDKEYEKKYVLKQLKKVKSLSLFAIKKYISTMDNHEFIQWINELKNLKQIKEENGMYTSTDTLQIDPSLLKQEKLYYLKKLHEYVKMHFKDKIINVSDVHIGYEDIEDLPSDEGMKKIFNNILERLPTLGKNPFLIHRFLIKNNGEVIVESCNKADETKSRQDFPNTDPKQEEDSKSNNTQGKQKQDDNNAKPNKENEPVQTTSSIDISNDKNNPKTLYTPVDNYNIKVNANYSFNKLFTPIHNYNIPPIEYKKEKIKTNEQPYEVINEIKKFFDKNPTVKKIKIKNTQLLQYDFLTIQQEANNQGWIVEENNYFITIKKN